ncbi:hypothetical protein [Streptomyces sp. NPDC058155]|uniref:hypothetical protein n=1 Tax=Streptomyces sp. NPDC058155 TaxID=3346359 RepID=UPI0036E03F33
MTAAPPGYVDRVRAGIFLAGHLYEHREGIRSSERPDAEMVEVERSEGGRSSRSCCSVAMTSLRLPTT